MGVNAGENLLGHRQSVAARLAVDPRLPRRADRLRQVVHLQRQSIHRIERQLLAGQVLFGEVLAIMFDPLRRQPVH